MQKKQGISQEAWFAKETEKAISYGSISQKLSYYETLSETIQQCNEQMYNAITTSSGNISMNPNLDGFIAEQHHVNTYNLDAAVKNSSSRAEVVVHTGERFTKNGVDTRIKDGQGHIESKYQAKFGKDTKSTDKMFFDKDGNYKYHFEQKLVPEGQEISSNSTSVMLSKDGKISSTGLTKEEAKQMQLDAQNEGIISNKKTRYCKNFVFKCDAGQACVSEGIPVSLYKKIADALNKQLNNKSII